MNNIPENVLAVHPDAIEVILPGKGFTAIYILLDPRTDKVRYVGKAFNPALRLGNHLTFPKWEAATPKQQWLQELAALALCPRMVMVDIVSDLQATARERQWILFYRARGEADCNCRSTSSEETYQKSMKVYLAKKEKAAERKILRQNEMKR